MQKILLLGGDDRQKYVKAFLEDSGISTYSFGFGEKNPEKALKTLLETEYVSHVLLPLPLSRDGKHLHMMEGNAPIEYTAVFDLLPPQTKIYAFALPQKALTELETRGFSVRLLSDEAFTDANAQLTARAAKKILASTLEKPLSDCRIALTGYGHVAKHMAQVLKGKAKEISVFARRADARDAAQTAGFCAYPVAELSKRIEAFDIVINTVPSLLLERETIEKTKADVFFLELASKPFGIDFEAAETLQRKVVKAPGLPGKYYPKEAAKYMAQKMIASLKKEENHV